MQTSVLMACLRWLRQLAARVPLEGEVLLSSGSTWAKTVLKAAYFIRLGLMHRAEASTKEVSPPRAHRTPRAFASWWESDELISKRIRQAGMTDVSHVKYE